MILLRAFCLTIQGKNMESTKRPADGLRNDYRRTLEVCFIISILLVFGLLHALPNFNWERPIGRIKRIEIKVEDIVRTLPVPPRLAPPPPHVPVPIEDDAIPEDMAIVPVFLDLSSLPEPPPPRQNDISDEFVFVPHEVPPQPKGGYAWINQLIEYPEEALRLGIEGVVVLGVLVNKEGRAEKITLLRDSGHGVGFEVAATEAVRKLAWQPARQRDKKVKVWVAIPIRFKISSL